MCISRFTVVVHVGTHFLVSDYFSLVTIESQSPKKYSGHEHML